MVVINTSLVQFNGHDFLEKQYIVTQIFLVTNCDTLYNRCITKSPDSPVYRLHKGSIYLFFVRVFF